MKQLMECKICFTHPTFHRETLALKDAYLVLNDRWTKAFSLTAGKFNRPNYEVEYSSSQRELPERSKDNRNSLSG